MQGSAVVKRVEPSLVGPQLVDLWLVDPRQLVDPQLVDPQPVDRSPVDPQRVDPWLVDPWRVDPQPVDPWPVDPSLVDPRSTLAAPSPCSCRPPRRQAVFPSSLRTCVMGMRRPPLSRCRAATSRCRQSVQARSSRARTARAVPSRAWSAPPTSASGPLSRTVGRSWAIGCSPRRRMECLCRRCWCWELRSRRPRPGFRSGSARPSRLPL